MNRKRTLRAICVEIDTPATIFNNGESAVFEAVHHTLGRSDRQLDAWHRPCAAIRVDVHRSYAQVTLTVGGDVMRQDTYPVERPNLVATVADRVEGWISQAVSRWSVGEIDGQAVGLLRKLADEHDPELQHAVEGPARVRESQG